MKNNNKYKTIATRLIFLASLCFTQPACSFEDDSAHCTSRSDCYSDEVCHRSRCTSWGSSGDAPASPDDPHDVTPAPGDMTTALPPAPQRRGASEPEPQEDQDMSTTINTSPDEGTPGEGDRRWPDASDPRYTTAQGQPGEGSALEEEMSDASTTASERCVGAMAPIPGELVINEVLMNVPTGDEGDANADGVRDAYDDEFIELVNTSSERLLLAGVELLVNDNLRHAFGADPCLAPGEAIVLFSGPRDRPTVWREHVLFMAPQSKLGLNNTAGKIELWDAQDRVLFSLSYEDARKTSYVLWPELTGTIFVPHDTVSDALFSPGRCADATALHEGCAPAPAMDDEGGASDEEETSGG